MKRIISFAFIAFAVCGFFAPALADGSGDIVATFAGQEYVLTGISGSWNYYTLPGMKPSASNMKITINFDGLLSVKLRRDSKVSLLEKKGIEFYEWADSIYWIEEGTPFDFFHVERYVKGGTIMFEYHDSPAKFEQTLNQGDFENWVYQLSLWPLPTRYVNE